MATLKSLVNETTNIKNELIYHCDNIKKSLISKGVNISPSDKVSTFSSKIDDINNKYTYDESIDENANLGYFNNTEMKDKRLVLVNPDMTGYKVSAGIAVVEHDAIRLSWDGEGEVYLIKNGIEEIKSKDVDIEKITDADEIRIKQVLNDNTQYIENLTLTFIKYLSSETITLKNILYENGNEFSDLTGGYKTKSVIDRISVNKNSDNLQLVSSGGYFNAIFYTRNAVSLNGFSKIKFDTEISNFKQGAGGRTKCIFGVTTSSTLNSFSNSTVSFTAQKTISNNYRRGIIDVDISSLTDKYHVFFSCYGYDGSSGANVKVYKIEMEVGDI